MMYLGVISFLHENVFRFHFSLISLFISLLSLESGQMGDEANVYIQNHEFYVGGKSYLNLYVWMQKVSIASKSFFCSSSSSESTLSL